VTLRAGSRITEISARGEDVLRFGDSAAVLLTRAPRPIRGAPYVLAGAKMRLEYAAGERGEMVHLVVDGSERIGVDASIADALRMIGILRGAAFWSIEEHHVAAGVHGPNPVVPGAGFKTYLENQVERPAASRTGNAAPMFPPALRSAHVEGSVLAQFVVDTLGRPEMSTFQVLKSTHDLFTAAVKDAVARYKFQPAELGGRKVRQLVQMPFDFTIAP
jgi:TonB family protein